MSSTAHLNTLSFCSFLYLQPSCESNVLLLLNYHQWRSFCSRFKTKISLDPEVCETTSHEFLLGNRNYATDTTYKYIWLCFTKWLLFKRNQFETVWTSENIPTTTIELKYNLGVYWHKLVFTTKLLLTYRHTGLLSPTSARLERVPSSCFLVSHSINVHVSPYIVIPKQV